MVSNLSKENVCISLGLTLSMFLNTKPRLKENPELCSMLHYSVAGGTQFIHQKLEIKNFGRAVRVRVE